MASDFRACLLCLPGLPSLPHCVACEATQRLCGSHAEAVWLPSSGNRPVMCGYPTDLLCVATQQTCYVWLPNKPIMCGYPTDLLRVATQQTCYV